jgi:arylsulfatase A-like enzyme
MAKDTLLIVTSDHGHSIGEQDYMGKRPYPSGPEVVDIPLLIRHPEGLGAGKRSATVVQHHDIAALVLEQAGVEADVEGVPFLYAALKNAQFRDHVTVGWGPAVTVIEDGWWMNCKIDGTGAFLRKLAGDSTANLAEAQPDRVASMFAKAVADAGGGFPDYLMKMAAAKEDAPGCSSLAARRPSGSRS